MVGILHKLKNLNNFHTYSIDFSFSIIFIKVVRYFLYLKMYIFHKFALLIILLLDIS